MSYRYQFPPMKDMPYWSLAEQERKMADEVAEVMQGGSVAEKLLEAFDVIHATETYIRIIAERYTVNLEDSHRGVIEKNRRRGYYADSATLDSFEGQVTEDEILKAQKTAEKWRKACIAACDGIRENGDE